MRWAIVAALWWTAAGWAEPTPRTVWLHGPYAGTGGRSYELWLDDHSGVLGVEAAVLIQGQAELATVSQPPAYTGFMLAHNTVQDTLLLALARASAVDTAGALVSYTLPDSLPPPLVQLVRVRLNNGAIPVQIGSGSGVVLPGPPRLTYELPRGWSMVSLPVVPDDRSLSALFPDAISAFRYAPQSGYQTVTALDSCVGYWVNLGAGGQYPVVGTRSIGACAPALGAGWSLIGGPHSELAAAQLGQEPPGILISVFGYANGYYAAQTLKAGAGYWVNLATAGRLWLPAPPE